MANYIQTTINGEETPMAKLIQTRYLMSDFKTLFNRNWLDFHDLLVNQNETLLRSLRRYTHHSYINWKIRQTSKMTFRFIVDISTIEGMINFLLDSPEELLAFRGIRPNSFFNDTLLSVGNKFIERGFASMSISVAKAMEYAEELGSNNLSSTDVKNSETGYLLIVKIPSHSKFFYLGDWISLVTGEQEILLRHGIEFTIVDRFEIKQFSLSGERKFIGIVCEIKQLSIDLLPISPTLGLMTNSSALDPEYDRNYACLKNFLLDFLDSSLDRKVILTLGNQTFSFVTHNISSGENVLYRSNLLFDHTFYALFEKITSLTIYGLLSEPTSYLKLNFTYDNTCSSLHDLGCKEKPLNCDENLLMELRTLIHREIENSNIITKFKIPLEKFKVLIDSLSITKYNFRLIADEIHKLLRGTRIKLWTVENLLIRF